MTPRPAYEIVSGGQTGVDRAALDVALARGLACGGWCPAGRWAEDGAIPGCYPLRETARADPAVRTRLNVIESNALVVLAPLPLQGGTALAVAVAEEVGVPSLVLDPGAAGAAEQIAAWLYEVLPAGGRVNVAGPRESEVPGVYAVAVRVLDAALRR